jgi:hypothetical protein
MAPSQPAAAVAGVQLASRQHSSLLPFFQTSSLEPLRQLSMVCAPATVAKAAEATNRATLFNFFTVSPLAEGLQQRCDQKTGRSQCPSPRTFTVIVPQRKSGAKAASGEKALRWAQFGQFVAVLRQISRPKMAGLMLWLGARMRSTVALILPVFTPPAYRTPFGRPIE